jgi:hypothetical protein
MGGKVTGEGLKKQTKWQRLDCPTPERKLNYGLDGSIEPTLFNASWRFLKRPRLQFTRYTVDLFPEPICSIIS